MINLPQIPTSKTLGFVFLGILLYLGSTYFNIQEEGSASFGITISYLLIAFGVFAQIINWFNFWKKA